MTVQVSNYICQDLIENNCLCENDHVGGKGFDRKGDLAHHRRIHTGIMYVADISIILSLISKAGVFCAIFVGKGSNRKHN
jgi:hypothetical protein